MTDVLLLKVGLNLAKFLDPAFESDFILKIQNLRNKILKTTGKNLPKVRVQDVKDIPGNYYQIYVNGVKKADKKVKENNAADEIFEELKAVIKNNTDEIF